MGVDSESVGPRGDEQGESLSWRWACSCSHRGEMLCWRMRLVWSFVVPWLRGNGSWHSAHAVGACKSKRLGSVEKEKEKISSEGKFLRQRLIADGDGAIVLVVSAAIVCSSLGEKVGRRRVPLIFQILTRKGGRS